MTADEDTSKALGPFQAYPFGCPTDVVGLKGRFAR